MQKRIIARVLEASNGEMALPLPMRLVSSIPVLHRLVGRAFGMGVRPEHIDTRERSEQ